jgi:hypothetical protein
MNIYTQILSITLGGLLSISEILPFIKTVKTNGIMHFLVDSIVDCNPEDLEKLMEREPLLTSSETSTTTTTSSTSSTSSTVSIDSSSNDTTNNDLNTKVTETLQDNDKKLDIISSELRKLDIIDHNLQEYISQQYNDDRKFKVVIKDDINDILHQLKDIKVETSEILSDKHECTADKHDYIVTKICDHVNKTCEHLNNVNIENTKLTIDHIKNDFNIIDIETILNNISHQLREIKEDKAESFSRKNVEDILEMILQHLRDLQRSQLQWTHNYGENNIKNDLKFEQIIERMNEIHELLQSNKLSHKISDQLIESVNDQINSQKKHTDELKHQFQNDINEHVDKMNEQFLKQLNMFKEMNNNFETNFIELKRKLADVTNKVDEVVSRSNEYSEKKKKRSFLNGSG